MIENKILWQDNRLDQNKADDDYANSQLLRIEDVGDGVLIEIYSDGRHFAYASEFHTHERFKVTIIDRICELHPYSGVAKGWSEYTGGMMDSGRWHFRKMLDVPTEELIAFFEENTKPVVLRQLTEQEKVDSKIIHQLPGGGWFTEQMRKHIEEHDLMNYFFQEIIDESTKQI